MSRAHHIWTAPVWGEGKYSWLGDINVRAANRSQAERLIDELLEPGQRRGPVRYSMTTFAGRRPRSRARRRYPVAA